MKSTKTGLTRAINWNRLEDPVDLEIWNKLMQQFWVPEKIAISNDIPSWNHLTQEEKTRFMRVLTGLTMLDTLQAEVGITSLLKSADTPHAAAWLTFVGAQESIHARSYSNIFSTLASSEEIDEAFRWSEENEYLQNKVAIVESFYDGDNPHKTKIVSVFLESFLFFSGFYLPFKMSSRQKLINSSVMISLILKDEAVHSYAISHKYRRGIANLSDAEKEELEDFTFEMLQKLYDNEVLYTQELYDGSGWTEDVKAFLRYNANRALSNLGYDGLFPVSETQFDPAVRSAMSLGSDTNDFFSTQSSSYAMPKKIDALEDSDFDDMWGDED